MKAIHYTALLLLLASLFTPLVAQEPTCAIVGRVVEAESQQPIPFATVIVEGSTRGSLTDMEGYYRIEPLDPNSYQISVSYLGYNRYLSTPIRLVTGSYELDIRLVESNLALQEVVVQANPFRKRTDTPLAMQLIGFQEIDKSAGGNRDISRVVTAFPGVGASVAGGYRNDLLVRGGGPSENRFYLDEVEIPNINHFSTQGASGGPASILNADFMREVEFYTGAFPASYGNALSSVLSFKLRDGGSSRKRFRVTVGASEVGATVDTKLGESTSLLASIRHSYLQLLFRLLDLPLLPQYTDAQFKLKHRIDRQQEVTLLGIGGIDRMSLNSEVDSADAAKRYLVNYLPIISQNSYTVGGVYKFLGERVQHLAVLSYNFLLNENVKYRDNDDSQPDNLMLDYHATEGELHGRYEYIKRYERIKLTLGASGDYVAYHNRTEQQLFAQGLLTQLIYDTRLHLFRWGVYGSATYTPESKLYSLTAALRSDANNYSSYMSNPLRQLSPRLTASFRLAPRLYLNGNGGIFYQLPPYTTMGYKDSLGAYINREGGLRYLRSSQLGLGVEYRVGSYAKATVEGFYKHYTQGALSLADSIPLACKGADYGVVGNEAVSSTARGRAYGVEAMFRWVGAKRLNLLASYTWFRSLFLDPRRGVYLPSAWDNQHLFTLTAGYQLPRRWRIGIKYRVVGGNPYTPYDEELSALAEAWNATARPYLDYSRYNEERLPLFTQLDVRVDKEWQLRWIDLSLYLDLQNALNTAYTGQPIYMSTGRRDPLHPERYVMQYIDQTSGQIVPTLGMVIAF